MTAVLLEPHHDDACLFACFLALQHKAMVVTVLGQSDLQESRGHPITAAARLGEGHRAIQGTLGLLYQSWRFSDLSPDWDAVGVALEELKANGHETVIVPAWEVGGHEQHNMLAELAAEVWPDVKQRITYLTYTRNGGRSNWGTEVLPAEPRHIGLKLRALACYESQMGSGTGTDSWFLNGIREYVA